DTTTYLLHGETVSNPPETERLSLAAYNNNYITSEVKAWHESDKGLLSSVDTANGGGWWVKADAPPGSNGFMTQTMWGRFEDDATYPNLYWDTDHSTYTLDPGFTNYPTSEDDVIAFARYMCSDPDESYTDNLNFETGGWGIGPEGATLTFPVDEDAYDLSYTNAELLCAAYGGYPLGDLNWFPDLKAQWENDANKENYQSLVAAVKDGEIALSDQCAAVSVFEREVENTAGINIYPNPATELLHIDGAEGELKTIYSITGQKLLQSRENQINISNLRSGLYLIKIENTVQKFNVK
ncbi:MAG: T9SS type A sorting domain-containing protein, partial [Bacteroidales bacterium]